MLRNLATQFAVYATGRVVSFGDRPLMDKVIRRTESRGGGIRTLLHELVASPLFTGKESLSEFADTWEPTAGTNVSPCLMMTVPLADVEFPVMAKIQAKPEEPPGKIAFDDDHTVKVQVAGLFIPERGEDFRKFVKQIPEMKLIALDYETATATIGYAPESHLFYGAKPEQIMERIDNRVRQYSGHTLRVKAPSTIPEDKLERVEIGIVGLDCKACSLGVYNILSRIEGVHHATASFRVGLAVAWIDPSQTNRTILEETLKQRHITLSTVR